MSDIRTVNPATGERLAEYRLHSAAEVGQRVAGAREALSQWSRASFPARAEVIERIAGLLRERRESYARLMALEMGKPVAEGRKEIEKCAWACEVFAREAGGWLASEPVETGASRSYVAFQPLGVVLAVMPWNFPFWQVFRFAAPALMAGNAALVKHAAATTGCSLAIEALVRDAGAPEGLLTALLVDHDAVGRLIERPEIAAVTLTGSTEAGRSVASAAGRAVKKIVLELGGSDAYLVLEDADLDLAVKTCVAARLVNGGQSCVAAKRFLVVDAVRAEFTERFVEGLRAKVVGDPLREDVDLGPQAREDLRDALHEQVERSVARGARLLLGGNVPKEQGAWYPPSLLADVEPGMPAFDEELFGPVAAVVPVAGEREAVRLANASRYGLGAAVFTRDVERGERVALELEAGVCVVNGQVASDPRLPFGGVKDSGFGRELGRQGLREFVNVKSVRVG